MKRSSRTAHQLNGMTFLQSDVFRKLVILIGRTKEILRFSRFNPKNREIRLPRLPSETFFAVVSPGPAP